MLTSLKLSNVDFLDLDLLAATATVVDVDVVEDDVDEVVAVVEVAVAEVVAAEADELGDEGRLLLPFVLLAGLMSSSRKVEKLPSSLSSLLSPS